MGDHEPFPAVALEEGNYLRSTETQEQNQVSEGGELTEGPGKDLERSLHQGHHKLGIKIDTCKEIPEI